MADLSNDPILWDVRILERRLRRGEVSDKQLQAYLQTLPDVADKALEAAGLLATGRATEILDTVPLPEELHRG